MTTILGMARWLLGFIYQRHECYMAPLPGFSIGIAPTPLTHIARGSIHNKTCIRAVLRAVPCLHSELRRGTKSPPAHGPAASALYRMMRLCVSIFSFFFVHIHL